MKFYINFTTDKRALPKKGKALALLNKETDVIPVPRDFKYKNIPKEKCLVVVVDYSSFDVAYLLTEKEYKELSKETRPYRLLLMDQQKMLKISGMKTFLNL